MSIFDKPVAIDQFYADLLLSIARGMVTRPKDLEAGISKIQEGRTGAALGRLPRYLVTAQCHAHDMGILMGAKALHVMAFKTLLRAASTKRNEFCDLTLDEPFGIKSPYRPTPLDPCWDRDKEVADLIWAVANDCWSVIDTTPKSVDGKTIITIESERRGVPEEELCALKTLMKAWGRTQGRTIVLEMK